MDRKKLAVKSSAIGLGSNVLTALLAFVCRKYFLQYLGADLLGVSGTLTQILATLSLTELGFQTAIIFQLYKPLAENNREEISKIVMLLKKIYTAIGVIILVIGIALTPFLRYIITRIDVDFSLIYSVYFIMLFGTASSYFLAYNRALLQADQKVYINNIIDSTLQLVTLIIKLASLVLFKSFILYSLIGCIQGIIGNIGSYIYYRKNYSWIDRKAKADKVQIKNLLDNTKNVFLGKIGGYVYGSTDNLVISTFVGTRWVGLVGNYSTIISAIKMIIFGITGPIQPMLGNFAVSNSKEETERIMMNYGFIRFAMALFLLMPTIFLSDMFVGLFYGGEYVLSPAIVLLLVADLFIICMQGAVGEMIDALGYFKQEKTLYIVYATMNLLLSCIGAKLWGVVPVFVATVLSQLMAWVWRSVIAYKYYFASRKKFIEYWKTNLKYCIYFILNIVIIYEVKGMINLQYSYPGFVLSGILIEIITALLFFAVYHKKEEFLYLWRLFGKLIPKKLIK